MNVYDFDGTIYDGDSTYDIIWYGLKHHPFKVLKSIIKTIKIYYNYKRDKCPFEQVKESMLSFIFELKNYKDFVNKYVESHLKNIKQIYKDMQTDDDVIASASYDLWIDLFAKKIGVKKVIATNVDSSGKIIGKNCKKEEKVRRIKEKYPKITINNAYSDSKSDEPLLIIAKKGYVIEGNNVIPYKKGYNFKKKN